MEYEKLEAAMLKQESYKTVCISTGDITERDIGMLEESDSNMVMSRDTGFFLKLYEERESNMEEFGGVSLRLLSIIQAAHGAGYRMIEIDADAQTISGAF